MHIIERRDIFMLLANFYVLYAVKMLGASSLVEGDARGFYATPLGGLFYL